MHKRAPHIRKRALYTRKRAPYIRKRALWGVFVEFAAAADLLVEFAR